MLAMALLGCFITLFRKKKTNKEEKLDASLTGREPGTLQVMLERLKKSTIKDLSNQSSFNVSVPFGTEGSSTCKVKMVVDENPVNNSNPGGGHGGAEAADPAYEGGDEHDENGSMHRDFSGFDLQSQMNQNKTEQHEKLHSKNSRERNSYGGETPVFAIDSDLSYKSDREELGSFDLIQTGHVSDPGIHRKIIWASPKLKRSCSNLETRKMGKNRVPVQLPTSRSQSFEDLQNLSSGEAAIQGVHGRSSPLSVITSCSADRVMLKRRSSSQVLPSRSRRLWWKLFLWSHRNLHRPSLGGKKHRPLPAINEAPSKKNGYCSDTLEMGQANKAEPMDSGKSLSPESFSSNLCFNSESKKQDFHDEMFGLRPCNHWVAFSSEESSSVMRVDEWVNSLDPASVSPVEEETAGQSHESEPEMFLLPLSSSSQMMAGLIEKAHHSSRHSNPNHAQDVLQANNVIQSLNSFSTVAHISGMGLKVIPNISPFSGLRSVNLSGNLIVHIAPGSLPKSLHTLNISRNKIVAIEGLRELTRLRVLDLSYNRISRIGHGLSNCTLIKELYLAGNKISDVEGLHRLLKLTVLDLSFNKITTANALGQLVANYNSLLSLNLLGNPIQRNLGDNQLRKAVSGLLPQLSYLNKQSIKPQWAREAVMDSVAKAALGGNNSGWHAHRKALVRAGGSSTATAALASTSWSSQRGVDGRQRNQKHRSRSRHSASR